MDNIAPSDVIHDPLAPPLCRRPLKSIAGALRKIEAVLLKRLFDLPNCPAGLAKHRANLPKSLFDLAKPGLMAVPTRRVNKERWRPFYEALKAAQAGTAQYLTRVAPEVRRPALDILRTLAPGLIEEEQG